MTPGNNGASTPEDDDPFGYLYADGQANGATPPSGGGGYGYPGWGQPGAGGRRTPVRTAAARLRPAGSDRAVRPAGRPTAPYGQVPQQGAYGQPNAHYAAPETVPGGAPTSRQSSGGGRSHGPNTKGLLIGAIAVVAAVVIGIGVATMNGDSNDSSKVTTGGDATSSASESASPSASAWSRRPPGSSRRSTRRR